MQDIKNFTNNMVNILFPTYSKLDKDIIFILSFSNILKNDRFINDYHNLYIYPDNNELKLFFNQEKQNYEVLKFNSELNINKLPIFLADNVFNDLNIFRNIILKSKNEIEYNEEVKKILNDNPNIIKTIREYRNVFNQNYLPEQEYILKKILLDIDNEKPFSFGFKPKIKSINLDKVKNNLFNKDIFPISVLNEQYEKETSLILDKLKKQFPELFFSRKDIINNSKIEFISFDQDDTNNYSSCKEKSELMKTPYGIEDNLALKIKGLNFINSAFALHTGKSNSHFIFLKSNDGELLGGISYSNKNNSMINEIGFSFTSKAYRGCGVATKLYDILAKKSMEENKVLFNLFYTEDGEAAIPNIKQKLRNKYEDLFIIDLDYKNEDNAELNNSISNFNYEFKDLILYFDKYSTKDKNILLNIKKHYDENMPYIKENILNTNDEQDFIKKNIEKIKKEIYKKYKMKNKKYEIS